MQVVGFIVLGTFAIPPVVMRVLVRAAKPRAVVEWSGFLDTHSIVFVVGDSFIAIPTASSYISYCPLSRGFTDQGLAFYIAAIYNTGSVLGRILPNTLISDRIGVAMISLIRMSNAPSRIAAAVAIGIPSGVVIAPPQDCFSVLIEAQLLVDTRVGMGIAISGLGLLVGGPAGGSILRAVSDPLNWTGVWAYRGLAACVSGLVDASVRLMKSGLRLDAKALKW
ncbi:hypothetical protein F5Y07DRAFT_406291 [Xylaria sp. FL0933]|nr:hypothetical protein F5Y07DRAFT_406291 [Xylaria sp. FL0933]